MPASEFAGKWAVCPPVQITLDGPQSFYTETEAQAVPAQPTDEPQTLETEDQALAFLDGFDDLGAQRRASGWRIVPVRSRNEHPGPPCRRSVEEILKSIPARRDRLGSESYPEDRVPDEVSDLWDLQIEEALADETFLAQDWRFDEISARASWRQGHKSLDRGTVAEAISRVVFDLEESMGGIHPNASAGAVADFWESWQVQRHLARVLRRHLQRRPEEESQVSLAFRKIRVSLFDFASDLRLGSEVVRNQKLCEFPGRATWMIDQRKVRKWRVSDLCKHVTGLDYKTVKKIEQGERVTETTLGKVAEALSAKGATITRADIPND